MAVRLPPPPTKSDSGSFEWMVWFNDLNRIINSTGGTLYRKATDPTTADIPQDGWGLWKNTTNGQISLWVNDGGTITRIFAFALAS